MLINYLSHPFIVLKEDRSVSSYRMKIVDTISTCETSVHLLRKPVISDMTFWPCGVIIESSSIEL